MDIKLIILVVAMIIVELSLNQMKKRHEKIIENIEVVDEATLDFKYETINKYSKIRKLTRLSVFIILVLIALILRTKI
ncbi:MAG: hypothetical protein RR620_08540 [Clostridium sp.]